MAHFAKLDKNNTVVFVTVGRDEDNENELSLRTGDTYKKTSYNTRGGVHYNPDTNQPDGETPFRMNFAGLGYTYDSVKDAFIPPKPYPSWFLDEKTCYWIPPIPYPLDSNDYIWNEEQQNWILVNYDKI
jgi:hypothetical protein